MLDEGKLTKYASYFKRGWPSIDYLFVLVAILSMLSGTIATLLVLKYINLAIVMRGISIGFYIIFIPFFLSVLVSKIIRKKVKLKHIVAISSIPAIIYSFVLIIASFLFFFLNIPLISYIVLLLFIASLYSYWLVMLRFVFSFKKSKYIFALLYPIMYLYSLSLFGGLLFVENFSFNYLLTKLFIGMIIFLIVSYLIIFLFDKPSYLFFMNKASKIFEGMLSNFIFNLGSEVKIFEKGIVKNVRFDLIEIKDRINDSLIAVFAYPHIHYGPFFGSGGSSVPKELGLKIIKEHATPFVLHGTVNIEDNPLNSKEAKKIIDYYKILRSFRSETYDKINVKYYEHKDAHTNIIYSKGFGIFILSRAPRVTEDIESSVGDKLIAIAKKKVENPIIIDAHNSRFESGSDDELHGAKENNPIAKEYMEMIAKVNLDKKLYNFSFGSAYVYLRDKLNKPDIGYGYTSLAIFKYKDNNFCILLFDSNNILPSLRDKIISYLKNNYHLNAEIITNDTHTVNNLAFNASNVLGRYTSFNELKSTIDYLVNKAMNNVRRAKIEYKYGYTTLELWGTGALKKIENVSNYARFIGKMVVPSLILLGYIIGGIIVYFV